MKTALAVPESPEYSRTFDHDERFVVVAAWPWHYVIDTTTNWSVAGPGHEDTMSVACDKLNSRA